MLAICEYILSPVARVADWLLLTYGGGDPYGTHCQGASGTEAEKREARIMFICDPASTVSLLSGQITTCRCVCCEIIFIHWIFNFVYFIGRAIY